MNRRGGILKPCPFCGGRAVMIVEPRVLVRCVWAECTECHVTSPMLEYSSVPDDIKVLDAKLCETRSKVTEFWNTRATDGPADGGVDVP